MRKTRQDYGSTTEIGKFKTDDQISNDVEYSLNAVIDLGAGNVVGVAAHGLTVLTAAIFIVAEIAGAGVLALPYAVNGTGWIGAAIILAVGLVSIYTGSILGKAWILVQQRYPEYRGHVRFPYPALGEVTFGRKGRMMVSITINITLYGATCVFLIMASENVHDLLKDHTGIPFCIWLIIVAGLLAPLSWLGTPKDFWYFAVAAMCATIVACIILFVIMIMDYNDHNYHQPNYESVSFVSFAGSFGTILFAFGGHPAFPTFQTDMKIQKRFSNAVALAYFCILCLYLPIALMGYAIYASTINENVLLVVQKGPLLTTVEALITCHLFFAYVIVLNPVCQDMEELFNIPKHFTWKRMVCRTLLVGVTLFIGETIPKFGAILSLIGGSTTNLLAYVLPQVFYEKLCRMKGDWPQEHIPLHVRVLNYEIIAVGIAAGIASTYSAITTLTNPNVLTLPCFVNISSH